MVRLRQQNSSFLLLETSRIKRKIDGNSYLINRNLTKECDYMGKAILAAIVTLIVGYLGTVVGLELLGNWVEFGLLINAAVMGAYHLLQ